VSNVTQFVQDTFSGCTSLETLKTPATVGKYRYRPDLPYNMYDWDNGNAKYGRLPGGSLTLHKYPSDYDAIEGVIMDDNLSAAAVYDLQGRKVNGMAKGGIYVVNGRKVLMK